SSWGFARLPPSRNSNYFGYIINKNYSVLAGLDIVGVVSFFSSVVFFFFSAVILCSAVFSFSAFSAAVFSFSSVVTFFMHHFFYRYAY
ncbi:hypothetical protein, partial [Dickeya ananatis]